MKTFARTIPHPMPAGGVCLIVSLLLMTVTYRAMAQQNSTPTAAQPAAAAPASPAAEKPQAISSAQALYLVRSTLLTLNDANRSGNYTVLRDLAAPDFQTKNSAADLAQSFADLRRRNFDLFAAALLTPQFSTPPTLDASGRARMVGAFATRPLEITFDLTFQAVGGQWRLLAIVVGTPQPSAKEPSHSQPASGQSSKLFYDFRVLSGAAGLRW